MVSTNTSDFLSSLHDSLLVTIISLLPFKESVRASVLSKRWRNLCRETTSLVFKESEFVTLSEFDRFIVEPSVRGRVFFVGVMLDWVSKFTGNVIENFEIHLFLPTDFERDLMSLIEFATSRQVKNIVLNLSDRTPTDLISSFLICIFRSQYLQKNEQDVSYLLFNLLYVRSLTVCSFFLQVIQDCDYPMALHGPMKTRHLVMRTNMHPNDFGGIKIFLNSCPELESLTFDLVTTSPFVRVWSSLVIDPVTHWLTSKSYDCLEKTLKVVKVKNFRGSSKELHLLQYLIRNGRVLERVDLYEEKGLDHKQKTWIMAGVEEVQKTLKKDSSHLKITLYNA
ncbi:PREDICTED: putative F-box/LRR-repeat protein At1g56400 [Camelina sativa]|uniref:F-box/LRR-repeat protein At1g56400 n=1 Tax=Camelina sativa TaxID=90675 RepID=A0ABM0W957_CAMSA|nr:PREDICTED: putative F-box/LRR-repeat protein At1g56400 [Camelina sativa]